MRAMVTTGQGGIAKLEFRHDWPVPRPAPGEVLIKVSACGVNNTDVNTHTAWYSDPVKERMSEEGGTSGFSQICASSGSWSGATMKFPLIQGADVVGRIVAV